MAGPGTGKDDTDPVSRAGFTSGKERGFGAFVAASTNTSKLEANTPYTRLN